MSSKTTAKLLFLVFPVLVCCSSALAQSPTSETTPPTISPEKRAAIAELLEVTEAKKTAVSVFNSIVEAEEKDTPEMIWQAISSSQEVQNLTPGQREDLKKELFDDSARRNKRIRELFAQKIDLAAIINDMSYALYDKYFSEGEIKDLVTFYKSPTGKKSIAVLPNLFAESMSNTVTALKPKISEIVTELMDEEVNRARKELEEKKAMKAAPTQPAKPQ